MISVLKANSHFLTHGFLPITVRFPGRTSEFSGVIPAVVAVADFASQQLIGLSQR